jgi:hypothetical protein
MQPGYIILVWLLLLNTIAVQYDLRQYQTLYQNPEPSPPYGTWGNARFIPAGLIWSKNQPWT